MGRRVKQIPSPYGVGGETGCTAQEHLKSVSSYIMGEERTIRVWFSFLYSVPPWFSLHFRPWVSTFLPLFIFRANSLAPFDTLLTSNYLPISLLRHLETQSQRKRGNDHSGFFRLYRGIVRLWVPFACSLSGCIYGGR